MEEQLERLIRKLIFKKYPYLYDVEIEDLFGDTPNLVSFMGANYICRFKSKKCLDSKIQVEIDREVKLYFEMLAPVKKTFHDPNVNCYFDCGDGYEFHSTPDYNR